MAHGHPDVVVRDRRRWPQVRAHVAPLGQVVRGAAQRLQARLSSDCPLCGLRTRGGQLCVECARDACASLFEGRRCHRCALALPLRWPASLAGFTRPPVSLVPRPASACASGPVAASGSVPMSEPAPASTSAFSSVSGSTSLLAPEPCGCPLADAPFEATLVGFDYQPPAELLVLRLKNQLQLSQARALAALLAERVRQAPWAAGSDWQLVPVPASDASLARRGFNPAAEIARRLGQALAWPVRTGWLVRSRQGPASAKQTRLGRRQRRLAAQQAYEALPAVGGACVALVDDVMTTGSTACAAALALRRAGATRVVVLAAARTPQRGQLGSLAK